MKGKPQIHFWTEPVGYLQNPETGFGTPVIALNCCRAWDVPANGVFMLFMGNEIKGLAGQQNARDLLMKKLEERERALVNWYGRQAKYHLADIDLLPSERRDAAKEHQF